MNGTVDHLHVFLDRRYLLMTNIIVNVHKKLSDLLTRMRKHELNLLKNKKLNNIKQDLEYY